MIFQDDSFVDLYAHAANPVAPWRLALVTIMQFRETLADRQAAGAVRARIDWKYLLGLELTDPGFDFSVLSEFATGCSLGRPPSACWSRYWRGVGPWDSSKPGANSVRMRPMWWPRSARCTA